jgi:hypothetical protein
MARPNVKAVRRSAVLEPDAAGIDIGAQEIVPPDRDQQATRMFTSFTCDLQALADWLHACRIRTVAMESTGVYWIPLYQILEERGFEVCLVNAHSLKSVPDARATSQTVSGSTIFTRLVYSTRVSARRTRSVLCAAYGVIAAACCKWPPSTPCICRRR